MVRAPQAQRLNQKPRSNARSDPDSKRRLIRASGTVASTTSPAQGHPASQRPIACINIDVDTLSEDLTGDARTIQSERLRAITYTKVLPRFIALLDKHHIKATFFVIGTDIASNAAVLKQLAKDGHELANHTMHHRKQFALLPTAEIESEIRECAALLKKYTGVSPVGFRAPGYTITQPVIDALIRDKYRYDSSLNTSIAYNIIKRTFRTMKLKDKEYLTVQPVRDLRAPAKPYRMGADFRREDANGPLIEIPISLVPFVSFPFVTALLLEYGERPTRLALALIARRKQTLNVELHINEFTDAADVLGLENSLYLTQRWTKIPYAKREAYFDALFTAIKEKYAIKLLREVSP